MTTYYYYVDSGSVASTTSINKARKQSIAYLESHKKVENMPIYTSLYASTIYGYVLRGTRTYDGYVFCNKDGKNARMIKKDGSLSKRV